MNSFARPVLAPALTLLGLLATSASAQCTYIWTRGAGLNSVITAVERLRSGELVVGGNLALTGSALARRTAPGVWVPLGAPLSSGVGGLEINDMQLLDDGGLVVGGRFDTSGPFTVDNVAVFRGTTLFPMGAGFDAKVEALAQLPDGTPIAGGVFSVSGGTYTGRIAAFDGTSWNPLGTPISSMSPVRSLLVTAAGEVFAGTDSDVRKLVNGSWNIVGTVISGSVRALAELDDGTIVAGGDFVGISSTSNGPWLASFDGASWSAFGPGINARVHALLALPDGELLVGGNFTAVGGVATNSPRLIRLLDAGGFEGVGLGVDGGVVLDLELLGPTVGVGGTFDVANSAPATGVFEINTTCPAIAAPIGLPCFGPGSQARITLTPLSSPWIGHAYRSQITGFGSGAIGLGVFGLSMLNTPLSAIDPIGPANCFLVPSGETVVTLLPDAAGTASMTLTLPNDPTLIGAVIFQQALQFEFTQPDVLSALNVSNSVTLIIGNF